MKNQIIKPKSFSWSYSRYSLYKECPHHHYLSNILRIPEVKNKYAQRGIEIHEKAEKYLDGRIKVMPPELHKLKDNFKHLKEVGAIPEQSWSLSSAWGQADWKTAWLRMKIDAHYLGYDKNGDVRLLLIDFKTGQPRPTYEDQGHLYSTAALALYPKVKAVSVEFWYLDHGVILPKRPMTYKNTRAGGMISEWEKRIRPMVEDKVFKPKPGAACKWCSHAKSKGGQCKF